jgi:hypothetical protein
MDGWFKHLLQILSKTLYTSVVNILPCLDFEAHHKKTVSIHCHLQNCIHIMHPLQGQTDGSQRVLHLGYEYDGEVHPIFAIAWHVHKLLWGQALSWRRMFFMVQLGLTVRMCCCSMFEVSFYHSWCAPKLRHRILQQWYTASYSKLAKVCWKWWRLCGKIAS